MNTSVNLNPYPAYNSYIPQVNPDRTGNLRSGDEGKYIVTTKILVLALAVLFAVVFFVVCLHIYAKWIWSTNPARGSISFSFWRRRRRRRASPGDEIVLDADALDITTVMGLGKLAVEALPKFTYKMADHPKSADQLECAICLGKFEEDEMGRALPKCGHSFHLECIDMWLYSHSTCPLCRAVLELPDEDDDSSASLTFETPTIHLEPMTAPRRLGRATEPDQTILARRPPEPLTESEQASQPAAQDQESANKRADSIPANILFWGNNRQQATADSRLSPVVNNNSPRAAPSQVVIDIETDTDVLERDLHDTIPHAAHSSSPVASVPRGAATLHRLFGRGRLPASSTDEMRVRPFRPSPSPSPSATATATAAPA